MWDLGTCGLEHTLAELASIRGITTKSSSSSSSIRLSPRLPRRASDWMAILLWPLTAVIIGVLDVALTARVAAGLHLTGQLAMPVALLLPALLPAGYAGSAGLAVYLSPGHGFWPWGRLLAGPLLC